ncbi:tRNA lysidine(34) synthetase TilS [Buchnera aphidicola]|uniref:tRNA lysidine(34) synthetase TilS n=1 Tax=Buchnera aphidicola TaxID=9 RepID=UPI0034639BAC
MITSIYSFKKKNHTIKFRAIHINHNYDKNSNQWSIFCKNICEKYDVECIIQSIPNYKKNVYGIEAYFRIERYKAIQKNLLKSEILLTAHHLNDQLETFLLALKRGSGPTGLSSMPYIKKIGANIHCRPLLYVTKQEIKNWAINQKLSWLSDSSNQNIKFDRNFIRHQILPKIEKKWPFFIKNSMRSIKLINEENIILNQFTYKIFNKYLCSNGSLNIIDINRYNETMRNLILRHWIKFHHQEMPSYHKINMIYNELILMPNSINPKLQFHKFEIIRYKTFIYILPIMKKINNLIIFWKNYNKPLILPNQLGIIQSNLYGNNLPIPHSNEIVNIRFQADKKCINQNHKFIEIKKIWQKMRIPPWERKRIPMIYYNNHFITALGYYTSHSKILLNRKKWCLSWYNHINHIHGNNYN